MKKQYVLMSIWLIWAVAFSSCTKEEGNDFHQGYNAGKQSFEYLEHNMGSFISFFDLSLRMNAYLEIPEEEREQGEYKYFPDYQICPDDMDHWLGMKGQDTVFRVITDDLALTTETAVWKLEGCCDLFHGAMTIVCTHTNSWTIEITSVVNNCWESEARLKIQFQGEELPESFDRGDWVISGAGECISGNNDGQVGKILLNFEIAESLTKTFGSNYLFDRGILFMKMKDFSQQRDEAIKAELEALPEQGRQLKITYRGEVYLYKDH